MFNAKNMKKQFQKSVMKRVLLPRIQKIISAENDLANNPTYITSVEESPERFEIPEEAMKRSYFKGFPLNRKVMPQLLGSMRGLNHAVDDLKHNPEEPETIADEYFFETLEEYATSLGAASIGYTKVPEKFIFKDKAVIYTNAIVLTYEMDKDIINLAPSMATFAMIHETYNKLGQVTNKIAQFLREYGYAAQASHPLGGIVLYPPLAESAGLGYRGLNGLLITTEHGPRVRLSAVFTSIENLPFKQKEDLSWIYDFCLVCRKCERSCPGKALLDEPKVSDGELLTFIDREKCFPFFLNDLGCTVCIKECPFSNKGYNHIKARYQRKSYKTIEEFLKTESKCSKIILAKE